MTVDLLWSCMLTHKTCVAVLRLDQVAFLAEHTRAKDEALALDVGEWATRASNAQ
jgi:hypothetical protein